VVKERRRHMSRTWKGAIIGSLACGVLAWPVAGVILYHSESLMPGLEAFFGFIYIPPACLIGGVIGAAVGSVTGRKKSRTG
jgi:hypothetical protein